MSAGKPPSLLENASSFAERIKNSDGDGPFGGRPIKDVAKIAVAVVLILIAVVVLYMQLTGGGPDPGDRSRTRVMVDSKTGKAYPDYVVAEGMSPPYLNPDTNEKTLYEAERCYYTRDGKIKAEPTYVFIKQYTDPNAGETLCPDCGRVVRPRNPAPDWSRVMKAKETGVPQ